MHPKRGILTIKYPMEKGSVVNYDDYEKVLHSTFYNELRLAPEEHVVHYLIHATALQRVAETEKIVQILFETFNIPALILSPVETQALGDLFTPALRDAVVIHSGFDFTYCCVVYDQKVQLKTIQQSPYGGSLVTAKVRDEMLPDGTFRSPFMDYIGEVKEKLCYVAPLSLDRWRALYDKNPVKKTIPHPESIALGDETAPPIELGEILFMAPESLFFPSDAEEYNLANMVVRSLESFDKGTTISDIVLIGGSTMFPGLSQRLVLELAQRGVRMKVRDSSYTSRSNSTFFGASLNSDLYTRDDSKIITKEKYDEMGPQIVWSHLPCDDLPAKTYSS